MLRGHAQRRGQHITKFTSKPELIASILCYWDCRYMTCLTNPAFLLPEQINHYYYDMATELKQETGRHDIEVSQSLRQTGTSIFSVWARHIDGPRPWLSVVSGMHRFPVGCAHLPMLAWSGATVSFRLHPVRRRFWPLPSRVIIILAASDLTMFWSH